MSLSEVMARHDSIKEAIKQYPKLKQNKQLVEVPTLALNRFMFLANTQKMLEKHFRELQEMTREELKEYFSGEKGKLRAKIGALDFLLAQCVDIMQKSEDERVKAEKLLEKERQLRRIAENELTVLRTEKQLEELKKQ